MKNSGVCEARQPESAYQRHRPEQTLLYRLVEEYWPKLDALLSEQGQALPSYVREEFEGYLKCGVLDHGFVRELVH